MSTKTTNLGLDKPAMSDTPGITIPQIANNFDLIDQSLAQNTSQLQKIIVSYDDPRFGAKLDGITDDTAAIQAAHNYANANGYPIVQRNSTFVLNGPVTVKTDVDLTGSTLITTWMDSQPIEYNRTSVLFNIQGESLTDITSSVTQSQFTKGAYQIPSLGTSASGMISIQTSDQDMIRNDGGSVSTVYKQEANILLANSNGNLMYPLTKDYSTSTGFKVYLRKNEKKLTFKMPKVILNGAGIYAIAKCYRNNVDLINGIVEEQNASPTVSAFYTICEYTDCSKIHINNIDCPIIGRLTKTGENGLGYLFLFTRVANIKIENVFQITGWSGINGNWFRDIDVENCSVVTIGGHVNTFDLRVKKSTVLKEILAHGGGLLEVNDCTLDCRLNANAIETRQDYAGEWDGVIRVINSKSLYATTLVNLNPVSYDCGRQVVLPRVEIENCTMDNKANVDTTLVNWKGFTTGYGTGNYNSTLPTFIIDGARAINTNGKMHRTLNLQTPISNTSASGTIFARIKNVEVPMDSFNSDMFNSAKANFMIPSITNTAIFLLMDIDNSLANFQVYGTSNTTLKCRNCDVYQIRTASGSNVTTVGNPFDMDFNKCILHRPYCDLGSSAIGRARATVTYCSYVRFQKPDLTYDNQIAFTFESIVVYAKHNRYDVNGTLPAGAIKLFDYVDQTVWKTMTDNGTTANRPTNPIVGQDYFDTTLGKKITCKTGGASPVWVDGSGTTV
jgi:hypothetical protein